MSSWLRAIFLLGILSWQIKVEALEYWKVNHVAPIASDQKLPVVLSIPSSGLKRARALVVSKQGYRILEMQRSNDVFEVKVSFDDLAVMRYQFQAEDAQGTLLESGYFSVRQPSDPELERHIVQLNAELQASQAKSDQLNKALFGIKQTSPDSLAKRKNEELARALVILGQKERELNELRSAKTVKEAVQP